MKRRVLFVIESLVAAGAERSLVSLLSSLDYSRFDVDLQLWRYGGELEQYLPLEVNLMPPFDYSSFVEGDLHSSFFSIRTLKLLTARCAYSISIRTGNNTHADKARKYWRTAGKCIPKAETSYDIAIAYSQGLPSFYVADRVCASKKICWVNVSYKLSSRNISFQTRFYQKFKNIVCVSESAKDFFDKQIPILSDKTVVIRDGLNVAQIKNLAEEYRAELDTSVPAILTVARFAPQKGYDITLEACKVLKNRCIPFKWYAIGRGPLRQEMEEFVKENNLQEQFIFLGTFPNPYPFFKAATLYVQTSRNEGFGLSIAEARVLGKPVVTTEFDAVWMQMVQGKNGLVVPQDPMAVADAIERLLKDKKLYDSIVVYQRKELIDNSKEIEKFYALVD